MSDLGRVFPLLSTAQIRAAQRFFYTVEVGPGLTLVEEGEQDAAVLFLVEGEVAIRIGDEEISTAGPGAVLGEIALFAGALRIASIVSRRPCVYVVLDRKDYQGLVRAAPAVAKEVESTALRQVAGRLREAYARLAALSERKAERTPTPIDSATLRYVDWKGAIDVLRRSRLFDGAPDAALEEIAALMEPVAYSKGDVVYAAGSRPLEIWALAEGQADVLVDNEHGGTEAVATVDSGDFFGIAALLEDRPRVVTCRAVGELLALRLPASACWALLGLEGIAGSVFRTALIRALADQVAYANAQFAQWSLARRAAAQMKARLGIEVHGKHVTEPSAVSDQPSANTDTSQLTADG